MNYFDNGQSCNFDSTEINFLIQKSHNGSKFADYFEHDNNVTSEEYSDFIVLLYFSGLLDKYKSCMSKADLNDKSKLQQIINNTLYYLDYHSENYAVHKEMFEEKVETVKSDWNKMLGK